SGGSPTFFSTAELPVGADSLAYDPEKVTEVELGIKAEFWEDRVRMNLAIFHDWYKHVQYLTPTASQGGGIVNATLDFGKADIDGVELETSALVTDNLTLSANAAWLQFQFDDPTLERPQQPKWQGTIAADHKVDVAWGRVQTRVEAVYTGTQLISNYKALNHALPYGKLDDYTVLNARMSLAKGPWEFGVWGANLTDEEYYTFGFEFSDGGISLGYLGMPRTYGADVTYRF
ncbi:MAG: TonB-dependent receptor, partial [Steroidobacteraceae bacterium]